MSKEVINVATACQQALEHFKIGRTEVAIALMNEAEKLLDEVPDAQDWLALYLKIDHMHAKYVLGFKAKGVV